MKNRLRRLIGDKQFYLRVIAIVVPIIIQSTVTNVVSLLDNVMVGRVGPLEMSSVAIVNQLLFIFNLCIFGGMAGPGIFATQFAGAKDDAGVRHCFRVKLIVAVAMLAAALVVFTVFPDGLVKMYIAEDTAPTDASLTSGFAMDYLRVMLIGLLPFAVAQAYASTLREIGETRLPMFASIAAIIVNLILNYLLIFGKPDGVIPPMGVTGAAIATVISRYVEAAIIITYTHLRRASYPFIQGAYASLHVPAALWQGIVKKGSPLLVNEFLWSSGMAMLLQCYSVRGLDVVTACNISSTVANLFNVVFLSMGSAVSILVGQALGANDTRGARDTAYKVITLGIACSVVMGSLMLLLSPAIPQIYNVDQEIRDLACQFLRVVAVLMPLFSFSHCCYFILRSGGRTLITFLFDSVFTWTVSFAVAYSLAHFTQLPILPLYFTVQALDIIKCIIGFILVTRGVWINNIVADQRTA